MSKSIVKSSVYYIIIFFSVAIVSLTNEKWQSIPMLLVMYISPVLLILCRFKLDKQTAILFGMLIVMLSSRFIHPQSFRWPSYLYTSMFVMTYCYFTTAFITSGVSNRQIQSVISFIIKAYAIVLIIQQISVLLGLPVINESYGGENEVSLKQGALSIEASNSGPIVTILIYTFIKLIESSRGVKVSLGYLFSHHRDLLLSYLYVCIGSMSVSCIFSLIVFLLYFIEKKQIVIITISAFFLVLLVSLLIPEVYDRIKILLTAVITFDPYIIYETDSSSSARIAPYLFYLLEANVFDINFWLGHGMDYGGLHVMGSLVGGDVEDSAGMGTMIMMFYDFGLIVGALFIYFVYQACKGLNFTFLLYILVFFQFSLNHYVTWLFFMLVFTFNCKMPNRRMTSTI